MGRAASAPTNYRRKYYIGGHAIDRLRARYKDRADLASLDRSALANRLDEAVTRAIRAGKVERVEDWQEVLDVVCVSDAFEDLYALVKENQAPGAKHSRSVVTLYTGEQVARARRRGRWLP